MVEKSAVGPAGAQHIMGEVGCKWPVWLESLLKAEFFLPCKTHAAAHKNERNYFCVDCCSDGICSLCLAKHPNHRTLQIRKSSYHDCVRITDLKGWLDLALIQVYVINSAKIVFLKGRPQVKPAKGVIYTCQTCLRTLLDPVKFCSIGCKLKAVMVNPDDDGLALEGRGLVSGMAPTLSGKTSGAGGLEVSLDSHGSPTTLTWVKAAPPPLEDVEDSEEFCHRDFSDAFGDDEVVSRGREHDVSFLLHGFEHSVLPKRKRDASRNCLPPGSPVSSVPRGPASPSFFDTLGMSCRKRGRKGHPVRAPLW